MRVKYREPESCSWSFARWVDIPSTRNVGEVYLRRFRMVQTPWFALYVHWIYEEDTDRHPHDHPWVFWSFIVRGGYTEEVFTTIAAVINGGRGRRRSWKRWSMHKMPISKAHWITFVDPGTVTFVVTGRRVRNWCFWTEEGMVPWRQYLGLDRSPADTAPEA